MCLFAYHSHRKSGIFFDMLSFKLHIVWRKLYIYKHTIKFSFY
jgi:hypothetical protein